MQEFTLLLFDADETLLDFSLSERTALRASLRDAGVLITEEMLEVYKKVNKSYWLRLEKGELTQAQLETGRFADFLRLYGISADPVELNNAYLCHLSECTFLVPGALDLCRRLHGKYHMSVVTNGISWMQSRRIAASALSPFFEHVFISEESGYRKPQREFFDRVFSVYGDEMRRSTLMIGDSLTADIAGGNNAGIETCWIDRRGEHVPPQIRVGYHIKSLDEIYKILSIGNDVTV